MQSSVLIWGRIGSHARIAVAIAVAVFGALPTAACGSHAPVPHPPVPAPAGKNWSLSFDVEFDGDALDASKLTPCFDWNYGNCTNSFNLGRERYLPSQVQVSNGIARLVAEPLMPPSGKGCFEGPCTYKSGLVSTARPNQESPYLFSFTYGYVEARLKVPRTPGMFTAFWMLPTNPSYEYDYEIDILENVGGKPEVIYQTYHYDNRDSAFRVNNLALETNGSCPIIDYSQEFHTYGVDWQEDHVTFYVDGVQCGRFAPKSQHEIARGPMQIIINLMVDNNWQRRVGLTLPLRTLSDELEVDYLKVWQLQ